MPRGQRARRISQADVAKHAGVSAGVVSAVINNRDYGSIRISDATRARVREAVRELGYRPNVAAQNLARGSNRLLGVFTFEQLFPLKPPNFYHEFLVGIEEAAEAAEYNLLLVTGARDEENQRSIYARGVNSLGLADGALLLGSHENGAEIVRLADEGYPFVFVGQREFPGCEVSYVAADYIGGTRDLVCRAAALGHRNIIMVIPPGRTETYPGRRTGFQAGVRAAGLSTDGCQIHALVDDASADGEQAAAGSEATAAIDLDTVVDRVRSGEISAVVVEATPAALELRDRLEAAGLRVPEDVSVIGLCSSGVASTDRLTELAVPRYRMGQEATRTLLSLLADPSQGPLRRTIGCGEPGGSTLGPAPGTGGR